MKVANDAQAGVAAAQIGQKAPIRTCIVCRKRMPKAQMHRIARRADGSVLYDVSGRAPGRGAYVCTHLHMDDKSFAGRLGHALRCKVTAEEIDAIKAQFANCK